MALHGWLDNALSFSVVAPKLAGYRVIALDLSGQGFSDHRSPDATYHIWDDIPQLLSVADQLGFEKLAVAGHSRGAAIAVLLALCTAGALFSSRFAGRYVASSAERGERSVPVRAGTDRSS